ncbi:MAG: tryptophan 2,3-dioxygenase family protein [Acidimicrobiia bacterium]
MAEDAAVYYHDYLDLERLLDTQRLLSEGQGAPAHDEMLFIIVHQAYELWFKQILWELDAVIASFKQEVIREREMGRLVALLERVIAIQRVLLDQLDVLETMTPLDFLDFRDLLVPASGFQSLQFRLIENKLGVDPAQRMPIDGASYTSRFRPEHRRRVEESEKEPSLVDLVGAWLERTPFLEMGDFAFWDEYRAAVARTLSAERKLISANPTLDDGARAVQLGRFEATADSFDTIFDDERYAELLATGRRRLSRRAFMAALLISLYRDEPILQLPFRLLTALIDIDEGFTAWRQRHALMAGRMIGDRIGTGGTSGSAYLETAARAGRVWLDLVDIPSFLVPRRALPPLPAPVVEAMRFHWSSD